MIRFEVRIISATERRPPGSPCQSPKAGIATTPASAHAGDMLTALLTKNDECAWYVVFDDHRLALHIYESSGAGSQLLDVNTFLAAPSTSEDHELAKTTIVAMIIRAIQRRQKFLVADAVRMEKARNRVRKRAKAADDREDGKGEGA